MMGVLVAFTCPRCEHRVATASSVNGEHVSPQPGDVSICLVCGAPLEFAADMTPRWLTADEVLALPGDAKREILMTQLFIATTRPRRVRVRPR